MTYTFLITVIAVIFIVLGIAAFTNFSLDNDHYDRLKYIVVRWAYLVTFIGVIVKTFNVPYGIETVTIVAGFGAMLAGLMGVSAKNYPDDEVEEDDDIVFDDDDDLGFDEDGDE